MPILTSVADFFPTPFENTITMTLGGTITPGATTVPVNGMGNYSNGQTVVFAVDPSLSTQQVFTGQVSGANVVNVVWTEGVNVSHLSGANVIDYVSATSVGMISAGVQVEHTQTGHHKPLYDINSKLWLDQGATASAVNNLKIGNAATTGAPYIQAEGSDTNISINLIPKGSGVLETSSPTMALNSNPVWQYLGYAQITSNITGITSATPVQITGLTSTVTIPSGVTKVRVTIFIPWVSITGGAVVDITLWSGTVGSGTKLNQSSGYLPSSSGVTSFTLPHIYTPSAGSVTYNAAIDVAANTASLNAGTTFPAYILVECC